MFTAYFAKFLKLFSKGYETRLALLFFMSFFAGMLEFLGIALIFPLIILILSPEKALNLPYLGTFGENTIIVLTVGIVGAFVLKNLFMIANTYYQTKILKNWLADLNLYFFKKYLYSTYESKLHLDARYSIFQVWQLCSLAFNNFVSRVLNLASSALILAVIFAFLVWKFNVWALLTCAFFAAAGWAQNRFFKTKGRALTVEKIELMNAGNQSILSAIRNIKDIKIFGRENYFFNAYKKFMKKTADIETVFDFYNAIPQNIVEICIIFAVLIMSYGVVSMAHGSSEAIIASFGMLAAAVFRMAPLVNKIQMHMNFINANKPAVAELFCAYEKYGEMNEQESDEDGRFNLENSVSLNNVSFAYENENVLEGLNINIQKGEFVGIIGVSGVGKTTFMDVLMGLLSVRGEILVDGGVLTAENSKKWLNSIGYVPQEITTLPLTIAQNIAFGVEKENIDYDKINEVIRTAQLQEYVSKLQDGVQTKLSDMQSLSQGQKQRIGIARALYKEPEILFLDEITSALDVETENKITECLSQLKGSKTIIAIAHRLSTLKNCDRILYFKSKNEVLSGTFEELSVNDADFQNILSLSAVKN